MIRKRLTPILVVSALAVGAVAALPSSSSATAKVAATRGIPEFLNSESADASLSSDGKWLVFSSFASNVVDSPSGFSEIYALDTTSNEVTLLTQVPGGGASDGDSFEPVVCGDGSVVAFTTEAELLDPDFDDDFNGETDVYVILRDADDDGVFDEFDESGSVRIVRASVGGESVEADFGAGSPAISDDCSTVAFVALDPLTDDDLNDFEDVYVRDISALPADPFDFDPPVRASVASDLTSTTGGGGELPALSGDGSQVVYVSTNGGHVAGTDSAKDGVLIRDLDAGVTEFVSVPTTGAASVGTPDTSAAPAINADGTCVAFRFIGGLDLAPGLVQTEGVFLRQLVDETTTLVSQSSRGLQATNAAGPAVSPDCRYVGFDSSDSSLVAQDSNSQRDAYVRDMVTGGTQIISRTAAGEVALGGSSVRQLLFAGSGAPLAIVNSSAPDIGGADGGDGIVDPFLVSFYNLGFAPPRTETGEIRFTDVRATDFFEQGVAWLSFNNITSGTGPRTYAPTGSVNRGQMAAFLWRMMGQPEAPSSCGFTDEAQIPAFARQGACWLKANNITTTNPYNAAGVVNRGQMAGFLHRLAGSPEGPTSCQFTDEARIPAGFRQGACWLKANNITTSNPYNAASPVNRGQMAAFLNRLASEPAAWNVEPPASVTFPRALN